MHLGVNLYRLGETTGKAGAEFTAGAIKGTKDYLKKK